MSRASCNPWPLFAALLLLAGCGDGAAESPSTSSRFPPAADGCSRDGQSDSDAAQSEKPPQDLPVLDKTFDDIKFPMKKNEQFRRELITPEIEGLAGRRIKIRGYILPSDQAQGITQFVLVRDNRECCFGPGAMLYDCLMVTMKEGETTDFSTFPVTVEGDFSIDPFRYEENEPYLFIYRLDDAVVE